jgi:Polyketide cyclase / dehydrase and lipid transport
MFKEQAELQRRNSMRVVEGFTTPAAAETVWRILADVEHWRDWNPTILSIEPINSEVLRVGALYRVTQPGLRPAIYEVIGCIPNESFTWTQKLFRGALLADHAIAVGDSMTAVKLSFCSRGFLASMATRPFSRKIRQFVSIEARSLKERSEAMMLS